MSLKEGIKKVLVIGSGPIVIGQAAEFDYAGTQACEAIKEEGLEVVLVNSNPATIMTDTDTADKVYIEPLDADFLTRVIRKEKPDALLAGLGGQTGLNLAVELARKGVLAREGVELLGTGIQGIEKAEDRDLFRQLMHELKEPTPPSEIVKNVEEAVMFAKEIGYPIIVRPAYTMGGTGGGIAFTEEEFREIVESGLSNSPITQCLVEKSIAGFKEIEYEVMRDANDNCITVCNMENIDPVGIHTGDSIVVAPSQTLSDREYQMLRSASLRIIRALKIEGGCNVQIALDPNSFQYYIIEVNPRVSRSSALASKATGYPIAKLATKIALGYSLDELKNPVTEKTYASFEPSIDYVVSKIPRWPFDKFVSANRRLGTQMKATGEVMSIGRNFQESILKGIRSLEIKVEHLELSSLSDKNQDELFELLLKQDDERIFVVAELIRKGGNTREIFDYTKIDPFFLEGIKDIIDMEEKIKRTELTEDLLFQVKRMGICDAKIASLKNVALEEIVALREKYSIYPVYKMVDTCAGEFEAFSPYYYSTYEEEDEVKETKKEKILVLGSGPIRIGQGIEFDYATVHAVRAIQELGYEAIVVNNNPETVSTDFSTSDRLYFEPLYIEDVLNIVRREKPKGVIVQFGGQTAINLADPLAKAGVEILGMSLEDIHRAEDRKEFEQLLRSLNIAQPLGKTVTSKDEALAVTEELGFPVLVRPSFVLGGRAMQIVYSQEELENYIDTAVDVNPQHPVLIDRYMVGKELEVDAMCDGEEILIPGIMEHIERAGVHSGDSIAVYPTQNISSGIKKQIVEISTSLCKALNVKGLLNIQFVLKKGELYVIEVNPRSSRTVPFLSKVTTVPMAKIATQFILGKKIRDFGLEPGYYPEDEHISVKVPVFSFAKLHQVDVGLGPEMKSTGEVMGRDRSFSKALYKGLSASGMKIPTHGSLVVTIADKDKDESLGVIRGFYDIGFKILATAGTAKFLEDHDIHVTTLQKLEEGSPNILDVIKSGEADYIFNTLTKGKAPTRDGFQIRRVAVERGIVCLTSIDTAEALLRVIESITFSTDCIPKQATKFQERALGLS